MHNLLALLIRRCPGCRRPREVDHLCAALNGRDVAEEQRIIAEITARQRLADQARRHER